MHGVRLGLARKWKCLELVEDSDVLGNLAEDKVEGLVQQVVNIARQLEGLEAGQLLQIILEKLGLGLELTLGVPFTAM